MWLCGLVILTVLGWCSGYVNYGGRYEFQLSTKLTNNGLDECSYQIRSKALIERVHEELLRVKISDLKLFSISKKLPTYSFKERKSLFDDAKNDLFFIKIKNGTIEHIFLPASEHQHIVNLKRSFSNLLQFQTSDHEIIETDISGTCLTKYAQNAGIIKKTKLECRSQHPSFKSDIWGASANPHRSTEIHLNGNQLSSIIYKENINISLSLAEFYETGVATEISLKLVEMLKDPETLKSVDIFNLISESTQHVNDEYITYSLSPDDIVRDMSDEFPPKIASVLKENTNFLRNKELGKVNSAIAALKVVRSVEHSSYEDIFSQLKSKTNKKIIAPFLDILGAVQTPASHKAAMNFLNMDSKDCNLDFSERYLWALSTSTHHKMFIIMDLLDLSKKEINNLKLFETLIQTISTMVRKSAEASGNNELLDQTVKFILERLKRCKKTDDICHRIYFKGLANIRSRNASSSLVEYILNGSKSVSAKAMKAMLLLGKNNWNEEVITLAERVYLTNDTYDSSARVAALNILLETNRPDLYYKLFQLFKKNKESSELKEYLLQRLIQVSEKNDDAKNIIKSVILKEGLNHFDTYAQGGLSTAFDRSFMSKGYLSTAQEVKNGLLKEGYVHINFEEGGISKTVFTLGLFSKGLSSFVSDDSGDEEDEEASAGLELSVLGVEFRPFVFFEGQGELMGHVFSGAGSTLTPAYQALLLLKDEHINIPLGTGDLLSISIASLASVDLSGKIEISIWSRTAESLVQNSAGLIIESVISLNSPLSIREKSILAAEPQLKLTSDIKFSGEIGLCLQLDQPKMTVQHNTSLVTNVVDGSFKQNKISKRSINIPGKSYALNSKNNEMCNILYS